MEETRALSERLAVGVGEMVRLALALGVGLPLREGDGVGLATVEGLLERAGLAVPERVREASDTEHVAVRTRVQESVDVPESVAEAVSVEDRREERLRLRWTVAVMVLNADDVGPDAVALEALRDAEDVAEVLRRCVRVRLS